MNANKKNTMLHNNFTIGQCQVIPSEFSIQINGEEKQSLQPKFIEVLCYLAKHYPRVIPRDELIDNIWGSNSYVGDKSLTNAIWHLRKNLKQLNENTEHNDVIETIRKSGYRLLLAPEWHRDHTAENPLHTFDNMKQRSTEKSIENISTSQEKHLEKKGDFNVSFSSTSTAPYVPTPLTNQENKAKNRLVLGLFTLSLLGILLFSLMPIFEHKPVKITQVTQQPGSELFPAVSPDGRYLVYSQVANNQPTNLFMKDTWQPTLPAKQLTFDNAKEGHSVWSNDGQYLYFARKDSDNRTCQYIQLKVSSQQENAIADCPQSGTNYYYVAISADDKTLAVHNQDRTTSKTGIYFIDLTAPFKYSSAKLVRFSCNDDCQYKDRDMAFSPDGKYIAISRRIHRFSENIYLINLKTKATIQLTFNEEDIVGFTWHSDSKRIIYGAVRADVRHGFVLDIDTKNSQPLNLTGFSYPSFAKDSQQLYYQQRQEGSYLNSLQLSNSIASSTFPILKSNFNYNSPDYHSGNNLLVFGSNESGFYELWSAKPDGTDRKQLTNLKQNIRYPKWSHDGQKVAFLAPKKGQNGDEIYIYSLNDNKVSLLKSPFSRHNRPSWSFDDAKIITSIYSEQHNDIYSIDINNAETKRLTFDNARFGIMTSSNTLLYTKLKRGLWQKNINEAQPSQKIIDGDNFKALYAWTYHNANIYYHHNFSDHQQLISFDMNKKISSPLVRLPLNSLDNSDSLTYVTQQQTLFFASTTFPQANIKSIENSPLLK